MMRVVTMVRDGVSTRICIHDEGGILNLLKHGIQNGYAVMVREFDGERFSLDRDPAEMSRVYDILDFS